MITERTGLPLPIGISAMGMASVEHVLRTNAEAGVDTTLPAAVVELFRRGMDAGHAADSVSSLVELMKTAEA